MKFLKLLMKEGLFWLGLAIIILEIIVVVIFVLEGQWLLTILAIGLIVVLFFPVGGGFCCAIESAKQKLEKRR